MFGRILVPLDGSIIAEKVFPAVTELAKGFSSEVYIVGICETGDLEETRAYQVYLNNKLEQLKSNLADSKASVKLAVLSGKPAEKILKYAETEKINLIIMSSHGRSGIMPWSLGSTVNKVINKAGIPLLVVRAKEIPDDTRLFSRIIVPLDGSEKSTGVLPFVEALITKIPSQIYIIRVMEGGRHIHTIGGLDYIRFEDRDVNAAQKRAKNYLDNICHNLCGTTGEVSYEVRTGDAAKEIMKYANEKEGSLIIMSSHGHSSVETWVMGSVTSKITEVSQQSIWLIPPISKSGNK